MLSEDDIDERLDLLRRVIQRFDLVVLAPELERAMLAALGRRWSTRRSNITPDDDGVWRAWCWTDYGGNAGTWMRLPVSRANPLLCRVTVSTAGTTGERAESPPWRMDGDVALVVSPLFDELREDHYADLTETPPPDWPGATGLDRIARGSENRQRGCSATMSQRDHRLRDQALAREAVFARKRQRDYEHVQALRRMDAERERAIRLAQERAQAQAAAEDVPGATPGVVSTLAGVPIRRWQEG